MKRVSQQQRLKVCHIQQKEDHQQGFLGCYSALPELLSSSAGLLDATNASYAPLNLNEELMRTLFLLAFRLASGHGSAAAAGHIPTTPKPPSSFFLFVPLLLLAIQTFLPFATRYFAVAACCLHCKFAFRRFSIRRNFVPQPTSHGICHNTLPISFELKCHLCGIRKLRRSCCCPFLYASFCHFVACCRLVSVAIALSAVAAGVSGCCCCVSLHAD